MPLDWWSWEPKTTCYLPSREHFDKNARRQPALAKLLDMPNGHDSSLTKTEMVHLYGTSLGQFCAVLAKFGDADHRGADGANDAKYAAADAADDDDSDGDDDSGTKVAESAQKRPHSSSSEGSSLPKGVVSGERARKEVGTKPGHVSSTTLVVGSNQERQRESSEESKESSLGFVGNEHTATTILEQGTVRIAPSFIDYVLQHCSPQDDTKQHKPNYLVECEDVSRELVYALPKRSEIRATADGELILYKYIDQQYRLEPHRPALLEARGHFVTLEDGVPQMPDSVLGQMTCEALALRLHLEDMGQTKSEKYAPVSPFALSREGGHSV